MLLSGVLVWSTRANSILFQKKLKGILYMCLGEVTANFHSCSIYGGRKWWVDFFLFYSHKESFPTLILTVCQHLREKNIFHSLWLSEELFCDLYSTVSKGQAVIYIQLRLNTWWTRFTLYKKNHNPKKESLASNLSCTLSLHPLCCRHKSCSWLRRRLWLHHHSTIELVKNFHYRAFFFLVN